MQYRLSSLHPKKRAFITGAGGGFGLALAMELAQDGWTIGIADIQERTLTPAAQHLTKAGAKRVLPYVLDVAEPDAYFAVADRFLAEVGGLDLLINNAGVGDGAPFADYKLKDFEWIVGINLLGVVYGCKHFLPALKASKGTILNVASAAAFATMPAMAGYNVTKAGVLALSETLSAELEEDDVHVSCVMPLYFQTNVMQFSRGGDEVQQLGQLMVDASGVTPQAVAQYTLRKTGQRKLWILYPRRSAVLYGIRRHFPGLYRRLKRRLWANREKNLEKVRRQLAKRATAN